MSTTQTQTDADTNAEQRLEATTADATDAEIAVAISCPTCGSILPLDTIEPSDRDSIECPHCRRVRGPEVLLR